ncbi:hypothetical protein GXW78_07620 [Roseomonas terrae]|uniref:Phage tail protein n=1 Tax=Neoroseomonas terrae TaxID=424799 RepID=A0ABS5EET1_9PROT|nr:gpW family head-tail joining protein [Neoroseomonas terrae]MBR0649523.1 hypothetical protein [Neoroseomonas terrae]
MSGTLPEVDLEVVRARLAQAESARHQLLTGTKVVQVVLADGRQVRYSDSDRAALDQYIEELRRQLGYAPMRRRRAIGLRFG